MNPWLSLAVIVLFFSALLVLPAWFRHGIAMGSRLLFTREYWHGQFHAHPERALPPRRFRYFVLTALVFVPSVFLFSVAFVLARDKLGLIGGVIAVVVLGPVLGRVIAWVWMKGRAWPPEERLENPGAES